jgi:hypothetical protein
VIPTQEQVAQFALRLGQGRWRVLRVHRGEKRPVGKDWPSLATDDLPTIERWFAGPRVFNIGIACGPQPNGVNLVVLDVDMSSADGYASLRELCAVHGQLPLTRGLGLWSQPVAPIPPWLLELCLKPVPAPRPVPTVVNGHDDSWADWLRANWVWESVLVGQGHSVVRQHGEQVFFRHPSASSEHSAVVHLDSQMMVAWSTNMPSALRPAQVNRDGSISWSPFDWFVATECGGSTSEACRRIDDMRGTVRPPARAAIRGPDAPSLNLAAGFWGRRPVLEHILVAARAGACSPDALLIHALARSATFLHPCFKLPGVVQGSIGKQQTLDFLGCVVAETSGGKTLAAGVGELLIPAPDPPVFGDPPIDFEQKVGSGEGIAEFFLVPEMQPDDDGKLKPTGKRVIGRQALFMNVDEGTGFTNAAARKGTTIIATLASAWSGESLGQLNANADTKRLVRGGRVRICAVINMQDSNGYKLYADELESVGFTGRLLFASAHDVTAPLEQPLWPGPMRFPVWPGVHFTDKFFSYHPDITAEIKATRNGILTKKIQIDRRESQYLLLRCKVAALMAMWDDRLDINLDDWDLATSVIAMSSANLMHLDATHNSQVHELAVTSATMRKVVDREAEDLADRRVVATKVVELRHHIPAEGISPGKLRKCLKSTQRDLWTTILEHALRDGVWDVKEGRIFKT